MNKSSIGLAALLALAGSAGARSGVTIYGRIDLGLVMDSGAASGKSIRVSSGVAKGSRLGFKGSEDLGGGYRASLRGRRRHAAHQRRHGP